MIMLLVMMVVLNIQSKCWGTDSVPIPTGFENDLGRLHFTNGRSLKLKIGKNSWVVNEKIGYAWKYFDMSSRPVGTLPWFQPYFWGWDCLLVTLFLDSCLIIFLFFLIVEKLNWYVLQRLIYVINNPWLHFSSLMSSITSFERKFPNCNQGAP